MYKFKLGYYTAKALIILGFYFVFAVCELNINILEWAVYSRLLFVGLCVASFLGQSKLTNSDTPL